MTGLRLYGYIWLAVALVILVACVVPTASLERWRARRDLRKGWRWR